MLRVRYYRVRLPIEIAALGRLAVKKSQTSGAIAVVRAAQHELIAAYRLTRSLRTLEVLPDGSERSGVVSVIEKYQLRFFSRNGEVFLAIVDPPRGGRVVSDFLEVLLGNEPYAFEALELTQSLIDRHISKFSAAKLVSARVKDFQAYEGAVARLEISSKDGLQEGIAPFVRGHFYRVDLLTYEVIEQLVRGLVTYSSSGVVRCSGPLVQYAFPAFEECL